MDVLATPEEVSDYGQRIGLTMPIAFMGALMPSDFKIKRQSTKVALDLNGIVVYRGGYGSGSLAEYEKILADLAASVDAS